MISTRYYAGIRKREQKPPQENPLTLIWGSDSHVKASVDGDPGAEGSQGATRKYYTAGQKLQNFVDDVNRINPDLVFFGGDMVNGTEIESKELFMSKWSQLDPIIRKELTIGNHDLPYLRTNDISDIEDTFGYGERSKIAGSKFNQSFVLSNQTNSVKVIIVDTNIDEDGTHYNMTEQKLKKPVRDWVESELLNSEQNHVILLSHAGVEDDYIHFNRDDAQAFKTMVENTLQQKPELKIYNIYGHRHQQSVYHDDRLGNMIESYSCPAIVDNEIGKYVEFTFSEENGLYYTEHEVIYPYP